MTIVATGNNIVIGVDGAIVTVGDNPNVRANTGDASASGAIAIDPYQSTLSTGASGQLNGTTSALYGSNASTTSSGMYGQAPPITTTGASSGGASTTGGGGPIADRSVAIAGIEDHSLEVDGNENVLTYDDSNVFVNRNGALNGNTGDTDTSGLNAVDIQNSTVRSGASGNSDESPDDPPFSSTGAYPAALGQPGSPFGQPSASVADINGVSTATAADSLVVGGDGMDDNGVTVRGDRNIVTYDDGNVAVGGTGDVNAQIGDSDTAGLVAMGISDSLIEAGDSFLPAWQQAGAQPVDPFDGDDPDLTPD